VHSVEGLLELAAALFHRADLAQPTGILHGGLHSVLIDTAIAQALLTTIRPGFSVVTVRLDTNYFAPVRSGRIVASARVARKGKRIAHGGRLIRAAHADHLRPATTDSGSERP